MGLGNKTAIYIKNNIARLDVFHKFIGEIGISIGLTLWRPYLYITNFMAIGLFLVNPPEVHFLLFL